MLVPDLMKELDEFMNLVGRIQRLIALDARGWRLSSEATEAEISYVIEHGKLLADYHKFGEKDYCNDPVETESAFETWLDKNGRFLLDETASSHYLFWYRPCLIGLLFSCFEEWLSPRGLKYYTATPGVPRGPSGHDAYCNALKTGKANEVFDAFTHDRLPANASPLRWPKRLVEQSRHGLREARLCEAVYCLVSWVERLENGSPLISFYVDVSATIRSSADPLLPSAGKLPGFLLKMVGYMNWLQGLPRSLAVEGTEQGDLRIHVGQSPSLNNDSPKRQQTGRRNDNRQQSQGLGGNMFVVATHLLQHHKYDEDHLDFTAIRVNKTAELLGMSSRDVSQVINVFFDSHKEYRRRCEVQQDAQWLKERLAKLDIASSKKLADATRSSGSYTPGTRQRDAVEE